MSLAGGSTELTLRDAAVVGGAEFSHEAARGRVGRRLAIVRLPNQPAMHYYLLATAADTCMYYGGREEPSPHSGKGSSYKFAVIRNVR